MCDETQHGQFVALRALQEKRTDVTLTSVGGHPIRHVGRLFYASFVVNSPDSRVALKPTKKQSSRCISAACPGARRCASAPLPTSVSSWIFFFGAPPPRLLPSTSAADHGSNTPFPDIRATPRSFTTSSACPRTRMPARSRRRTARRPSRTTPTREATRRR